MESLRIVGSELKCQNFKLSPKYLFQFVKQTTFDLICRRYEVIPFSLSVMKVNLILFFFITFQSIFDFVNTSVGWKINGTKSFHFSKACPMTASHLNILLHLIDEILNKSSWISYFMATIVWIWSKIPRVFVARFAIQVVDMIKIDYMTLILFLSKRYNQLLNWWRRSTCNFYHARVARS